LEKRKIERAERRWITHGRRVLAWDQTARTIKVRLYDAWTGEDHFAREVADGSRGTIIAGEELAILEPSGQFTLVSLATGKVRFAAPLEPERSLSWIGVFRASDQYLLLASQENNDGTAGVVVQPLNNAGNQQVRMHGRVYAFSAASGKLQWQVPAFIANHCLPADQPSESPLLFFVRNRTDASSAAPNASVLALDRRTGRIVYENDGAAPQSVSCDIVADPLKQTVTLSLLGQATKSLLFQLTNKPIPPQPPAQTGNLASSSAGQPPGKADRSIGAAIELLQRGLVPPGLAPAAAPDPFAPQPR
jgi:hypothetical protein